MTHTDQSPTKIQDLQADLSTRKKLAGRSILMMRNDIRAKEQEIARIERGIAAYERQAEERIAYLQSRTQS